MGKKKNHRQRRPRRLIREWTFKVLVGIGQFIIWFLNQL
jgi:hypothetical protein